MVPTIEKISAITFRVLNMKASVQFYRNVLGMELLYGGEQASFSSLRANGSESVILNLEQGNSVPQWGRLIFHVTDVDALPAPRNGCHGAIVRRWRGPYPFPIPFSVMMNPAWPERIACGHAPGVSKNAHRQGLRKEQITEGFWPGKNTHPYDPRRALRTCLHS
jgi:catechol 2,3-dioxygenase-like lactoylglutathione lyase family enzyme